MKDHLHRDDCPETLRLVTTVVGPHGRDGFEPTDEGAWVDWEEVARHLSSTEAAVLMIAKGLTSIERRGGNQRLRAAVIDAAEKIL